MLVVKPSGAYQINLKNIIAKYPPEMLTTSSAIAAARDQVPFDETNLQNCMCVLILTKRDGTLFNVTSVMEEDIIEICIRLGHNHPMGVLSYSVRDLVILF